MTLNIPVSDGVSVWVLWPTKNRAPRPSSLPGRLPLSSRTCLIFIHGDWSFVLWIHITNHGCIKLNTIPSIILTKQKIQNHGKWNELQSQQNYIFWRISSLNRWFYIMNHYISAADLQSGWRLEAQSSLSFVRKILTKTRSSFKVFFNNRRLESCRYIIAMNEKCPVETQHFTL